MRDGSLTILRADEVLSLLEGREPELMDAVRQAYECHALGQSSLPLSAPLYFPDSPRNRIIALPAYLGDGSGVAGIKWVASFPGNLELGLDRASAVVILNSPRTGVPEVIVEGSIINLKRTAASAALAAQCLVRDKAILQAGVIGCGPINFETVRFLQVVCSQLESLVLFDTDPSRSLHFRRKCESAFPEICVSIAPNASTVLSRCPLISVATTALTPHFSTVDECVYGTIILHISLRDFTPEVILSSDNVVDDLEHVCRASTSVHLAEQLSGNRSFIRCTLGDILLGRAAAKTDGHRITIFSPFGLGILDLAVARLAHGLSLEHGRGIVIDSFLPVAWNDEQPRQA